MKKIIEKIKEKATSVTKKKVVKKIVSKPEEVEFIKRETCGTCEGKGTVMSGHRICATCEGNCYIC